MMYVKYFPQIMSVEGDETVIEYVDGDTIQYDGEEIYFPPTLKTYDRTSIVLDAYRDDTGVLRLMLLRRCWPDVGDWDTGDYHEVTA